MLHKVLVSDKKDEPLKNISFLGFLTAENMKNNDVVKKKEFKTSDEKQLRTLPSSNTRPPLHPNRPIGAQLFSEISTSVNLLPMREDLKKNMLVAPKPILPKGPLSLHFVIT
jgi:hypothetical protein